MEPMVKSTRPHQGVWQLVTVVGSGNDEYLFAFDSIDAGLYRNKFLRIPMTFVLVGELVHVIQQNDRRGLSLRFGKNIGDLMDKIAIGLDLAADKLLPAQRIHKAPCKHRFSNAGRTEQQ